MKLSRQARRDLLVVSMVSAAWAVVFLSIASMVIAIVIAVYLNLTEEKKS